MKKGIRVSLYSPKECLDILLKKEKDVVEYLQDNDIKYDIYLGEYDGKDVCALNFEIVRKTTKECNEDYKCLKDYLKQTTGKQPKQIMKLTFDRI